MKMRTKSNQLSLVLNNFRYYLIKQSMNKTWTIVIVVIIILLGGWLIFSGDNTTTYNPPPTNTPITNTPTPTTPATTTPDNSPKTITIIYSDSGFSPTPMTINAGDTVKFVNQSALNMWVASGPHPTHTTYPEFDQRTSVANGGSYSFIFTKTGTWPYHNHVNATHFGQIIVK